MSTPASSTELVPIWRIFPEPYTGGGAICILRDGSFRLILKTGAVNFDMKSEDEQEAISFAFGDMLASLSPDFPLQIFCHAKRLDTEAYMRQFDRHLVDEATPPLVRQLIEDHRRHFSRQVLSNNLLQREFYVVVPWGGAPQPAGERLSDNLPTASIFRALWGAAERKIMPEPSDLDLALARQQLDMRAAQIQGHLERINIASTRMGEREVLALMYELFNPGLAERQKLRDVGVGGFVPGFAEQDLSGRRRTADTSNGNGRPVGPTPPGLGPQGAH